METIIDKESERLLSLFSHIAEKCNDALTAPIAQGQFDPEDLKWSSLITLSDSFDKTDVELIKEVVLKRVVEKLLPVEEQEGDEDDTIEAAQKNEHSKLTENLKVCSVLLDFCFHMRQFMSDTSQCSLVYYELFATVVEMLNWPDDVCLFWDYVESRINWFKLGNTLKDDNSGETTLISYKQPLFEKLRRWNTSLMELSYRTHSNTPVMNEVKQKWLSFLSDLLPIQEESNFNRTGSIAKLSNSTTNWNIYQTTENYRGQSKEESFFSDIKLVYQNFIYAPLEFLSSSLDHKIKIDKVISTIIDNILELEEVFYNKIKKELKEINIINNKLNPDYFIPSKPQEGLPEYLRTSKLFEELNSSSMSEFQSIYDKIKHLPVPNPLDMSTTDEYSLFDQFMTLENDIFRKQFMIQVYFTSYIITQLIESDEVRDFFNTNISKVKAAHSISFDDMEKQNIKKASTFTKHLMVNRIKRFYGNKDKKFLDMIESLELSESCFHKLKMNGFKQFNDFHITEEDIVVPDIDKSFKKFGFVKMGNKQINNVWKIETGISNIKEVKLVPHEVLEKLQDKYAQSEGNEIDIVKSWQSLRLLRGPYLFKLSGINEEKGLKGLFEESNQSYFQDKYSDWKKKSIEVFNEPHKLLLAKARDYKQSKLNGKRENLEEESNSNKKVKLSNDNNIDADNNENENPSQERNLSNTQKGRESDDLVSKL